MPRDKLKGQTSIMEYLLLSFFILAVIIVMIFFLSVWFYSQQGLEQKNLQDQRVLTLMERFTNSPLLVKENSVFDDSKLMAFQALGNSFCDDLQGIFGDDWFLEVETISRPGGPCSGSNYPDCGSWSIVCGKAGARNISKVLPVNIYRKTEDRTDLGSLKAGVYT